LHQEEGGSQFILHLDYNGKEPDEGVPEELERQLGEE
jgi:hypothetical protein